VPEPKAEPVVFKRFHDFRIRKAETDSETDFEAISKAAEKVKLKNRSSGSGTRLWLYTRSRPGSAAQTPPRPASAWFRRSLSRRDRHRPSHTSNGHVVPEEVASRGDRPCERGVTLGGDTPGRADWRRPEGSSSFQGDIPAVRSAQRHKAVGRSPELPTRRAKDESLLQGAARTCNGWAWPVA